MDPYLPSGWLSHHTGTPLVQGDVGGVIVDPLVALHILQWSCGSIGNHRSIRHRSLEPSVVAILRDRPLVKDVEIRPDI
jgi:hypothetical protein